MTKPSSGRAWIVGALILVILGAAAGGGWWLWDRSQREAAREKATLKAESETREAEKTRLAAEKSRLADEKSRLAAEKAALDKDLESTRTSLTAAQTSAEQAKAALADTAQKVKLLENVAAAREQSAEEAMAENERLAEQAAVHSREFDAELRAKEDALKTAEERAGVLKTVLSEYDKSLFTLLTVRPDTKAVTEGCVAFLVAPKLLASTAACGQALADGKATGLWTMARIVRDPGRTFAVASWRLDAEAGLSVIELDTETTELPKPFVLAEPDAMAARLVAGRAAFAVRSAAHDGKVDIDVTVQRLEANTAELPAGAAEPTEPGQPSRPTDPAARASAASRLRLQAIATPPPVGAPIIDADARVVGIVGGTPPGQAGAADQMALSAAGLAKLLKP